MSDPKNPEMENGAPPKDETSEVATELQKLQEQAEKFKNEYLYLRAEFENYKKHAIKERSDLLKFGAERFARDLLGVIDNFERGLAAAATNDNLASFKKGVELTANELRNVLQKHGVTELPSEGLAFDPNHHEALASEPSEDVPAGNVLRVFQKDYRMHDTLLRPAQVVVAKKPE